MLHKKNSMPFKGKCNTKSLTIPKGNPKKDRQHNGQKQKDKRKNNDLQNNVL